MDDYSARGTLSGDELATRVRDLAGWSQSSGKIYKKFEFRDFVDAFAWMTRIAFVAESMNHHPEWSNVYKTVEVWLWTHDRGGVTRLDLELARRMNDAH